MTRTESADRISQMEDAFRVAPETSSANLPSVPHQDVIDDRPQGAIAVKVKRDLAQVMRDIKKIASAAGKDFYYTWNTTNKDGTKGVVEGPSVKCANAVSRIYGNCCVQVRSQDLGNYWILNARFIDLETGYVYERPYQQRKAQNIGGKMDKDRAADMVFQIGVSKAARNVVCNALSELTDYAMDVAKEKMVESIGKNLDFYKGKVQERLAEMQVDLTRAEIVRGKAFSQWTAYDVAKTISEIQTVTDGMAHQDDIWPPTEKGAARPTPEDFAEKEEPAPDPKKGKANKDKPSSDPHPAADGEGSAAKKPAGSPPADAADQAKGSAGSSTPAAAGPDATDDKKPAEVAKAAAAPEEAAQPQSDGGAQLEPERDPAGGDGADVASGPDKEGPAPVNAAEIAAAAFEKAEAWLADQIETFADLSGKEGTSRLEALKAQMMDYIRGWKNLDPEDAAVLLGRLNTAYLERARFLSRHKR